MEMPLAEEKFKRQKQGVWFWTDVFRPLIRYPGGKVTQGGEYNHL